MTFVEIDINGWDTHLDNFNKTKELAGQIDKPMAQLLTDLKQRGQLDSTLILWMGEFGQRAPTVNPRARPRPLSQGVQRFLAGGGIRGGQVIGQTDKSGSEITARPVTIHDLFQTVCKSLKINAAKENMSPIGRPIKIVDGGQPIKELIG